MKLANLKQDNSLSEKVYQQLYKSLVSGRLKPGEKITEAKLADALGISRAPIREAIKRLAEEHLLVSVPRSGCHVAVLTEKEIREIYEIRRRLECMALEHAFDRLYGIPKPLCQLMEDFKDCLGKKDAELIKTEVRLDTRLHDLIAMQSDCPNLQEMLANLRTRIEIYRHQTTATSARAVEAIKEHTGILQAIIDGHKELALKHLMNHIEHAQNNVLSQF